MFNNEKINKMFLKVKIFKLKYILLIRIILKLNRKMNKINKNMFKM